MGRVPVVAAPSGGEGGLPPLCDSNLSAPQWLQAKCRLKRGCFSSHARTSGALWSRRFLARGGCRGASSLADLFTVSPKLISKIDKCLISFMCKHSARLSTRSRTSGENLFVVLLMMLHPTQELEPPANPERFTWHKVIRLITLPAIATALLVPTFAEPEERSIWVLRRFFPPCCIGSPLADKDTDIPCRRKLSSSFKRIR